MQTRKPNELRPHPLNAEVYGDESVADLVERIRESGWVKPLVVTPDGLIVSGHRRQRAAIELSLESVDVEVFDGDDGAVLRRLLEENHSRSKTLEQKAREGKAWEQVYRAEAAKRRLEGQKRGAEATNSGRGASGSTTEPRRATADAAKAVGLGSRDTYERAAKVVEVIDAATPAEAKALRRVLNTEGAKPAARLAKLAPDKRKVAAEALVSGKAKNAKQAMRAVRQQTEQECLAIDAKVEGGVSSLEQLEGERFRVIYADPPWSYNNDTFGEGLAADQYETMSLQDICDMPVADYAEENCCLFMWGTNPLLPEALQVIEAWGFQYKTNLCWAKDRMGVGFHLRGQHELLLIATRGKSKPVFAPSSLLMAPRREHSRKPDEARVLVERMYPNGSRLELFARTTAPGWMCFGNQLGKFKRERGLFEGAA